LKSKIKVYFVNFSFFITFFLPIISTFPSKLTEFTSAVTEYPKAKRVLKIGHNFASSKNQMKFSLPQKIAVAEKHVE
jgi:hypothetical protein